MEEKAEGCSAKLYLGLEPCDEWCASEVGAGTIAVVININNLLENIRDKISMFADTTKTGGIIDRWLSRFTIGS